MLSIWVIKGLHYNVFFCFFLFKDFFSRKQPCRGMEEKFIQNHGISRNLQQTIRKIKNKK